MEKWVVMAKKADFAAIGSKYKIDPVVARIIRNRDVITEEEIENYLYGTMAGQNNPGQMKDLTRAVEILKVKIQQKKKIRIIGDYDIDGVCAVFILLRGLKRCGAVVDTVIPDRILDGYGINESLIAKAGQDGVDTILTCDNGIAAPKVIAVAKALGMTVIITDHHEVPYEEGDEGRVYHVPAADAVVNPKQQDCTYPYENLCGAGVAYKVIQVLYQVFGVAQSETEELLELAAFATIGDVMDLTGENRILVKAGLKMLQNTKNKGLRALIRQNKLEPGHIKAYHVGFILGPCLNASGRLDTAGRALNLLLAEEDRQAAAYAKDLVDLNASRKELTIKGVEEAAVQAEELVQKGDRVLVLYLPHCHESLAGIIAGRIREKYHRPVFVLTKGEDGVKGSGRSVEGYSMYEEMVKCSDIFKKYGGHPMAAGLSMSEQDVESFRSRMNALTSLTDQDLIPKVKIDVPMPLDYITKELIFQLNLLEPFGKANEKPVFADKNITVLSLQVIGKNKNVCKMQIKSEGNTYMEALYFGDVNTMKECIRNKYQEVYGTPLVDERDIRVNMSFVYYPELNSYQGRETIQIIIKYFC